MLKKKSTMLKLKRMDVIRSGIEGYTDCALCRERTFSVVGEGSINAKVMIIGEAPGQEEDRSGRPFVGSSGKKLNYMLKALGADRKLMYVTNVVKCRPPYNRVPQKKEVRNCIKWLEKEITLIGPRAIIPLGATAMVHIFNLMDISWTGSITANRGERFESEGVVIFPTFHPSYVLRNRDLARIVRGDIQRAIKYAKGRE